MKLINCFASIKNDFREMYDSRSVLKSLVAKDLFGRYKNSIIGFSWHFFMPVLLIVVYYFAFDTIRSSELDDFWLYLASGLFVFTFMISNLNGGSNCIVANAGMVKRMYFPRELIVIAQVTSSFIILVIGYIIIIAVIIITGHTSYYVLMLPVVLVLSYIFVLGYTFLLSAVTVYTRDVYYLINATMIIFYFLTPMYFVADSLGGIGSIIVWINPFTYYVEFCHQLLYYQAFPSLSIVLCSFIISFVSLAVGYFSFRHLKHGFAERL